MSWAERYTRDDQPSLNDIAAFICKSALGANSAPIWSRLTVFRHASSTAPAPARPAGM